MRYIAPELKDSGIFSPDRKLLRFFGFKGQGLEEHCSFPVLRLLGRSDRVKARGGGVEGGWWPQLELTDVLSSCAASLLGSYVFKKQQSEVSQFIWLDIRIVNTRFFSRLGHPPFFHLASNTFPEIGLVSRNEKKNLKIWRGGLVPQHHCWGAWKQQDIFRLTKRMTFKVNIYIFEFKKCTTCCQKGSCSAKNLGRSTTLNKKKKKMAVVPLSWSISPVYS